MQKTVAIVAVVVVVGAGAYFLTGRETTTIPVTTPDTETARTESEAETPVAIEETAETSTDDTVAETAAAETPYTVAVSYLTPSRTSHDMDVTLVIAEDGTITDASIVYDNGEGFSNGHQERFDNAYKSEVIGQQLEDIELSTVAGASLTTDGFNDAVAKIIAERA
jgi:hypothetical protein